MRFFTLCFIIEKNKKGKRKMKTIRCLLAAIRKADQKYNLIEKGDKIAIGISGGKDSLTLLYCLHLYQKFSRASFQIVPIILDLGFDNFNPQKIMDYCLSLGYKLDVVNAKEVYKILKIQQKDKDHLPCSICSKMKKASINKRAKELGCNKVAFAHHADDAIETLFMNEIYGARIATFTPKMTLERADITFIRPLCLVREKQIIKFAKEENLPVLKSSCPADKHTTREDIKIVLNDLYKKFPNSYDNFLTMLDNYTKLDLWDSCLYLQVDTKGLTLKPVSNKLDKTIEMNLRLEIFYDELNLKYKKEKDENQSNVFPFIIYKKEKPIGIIRYKEKENRNIEIDEFDLIKKYRNKGYGKKVFTYLLTFIKEKYNPVHCYICCLNKDKKYFLKFNLKQEDKTFKRNKQNYIKMAIDL